MHINCLDLNVCTKIKNGVDVTKEDMKRKKERVLSL